MLKQLHKNDTQITPFIVTKNWELSNVINEDVILMEHSGSAGLPVAVEYLEYGLYNIITSSKCDIAQEQQHNDLAHYRDGKKLSGIFYPDVDPINKDGTYQRMVYSQVTNMFYNNYKDVTKLWGVERIDFDTSQTKRFVADRFKMFEIPRSIFGEKVIENSVILYDSTTDNDYVIQDDGNCNLFAGRNLFSHQQEIGIHSNYFIFGSSSYCDVYDTVELPSQPRMSIIYDNCTPSINISWNVNEWFVSNYVIEKSLNGISYTPIFNGLGYSYIDTDIYFDTSYFYRMCAVNALGTSSYTPASSVFTSQYNWYWDTDSDTWDTAGHPQLWDVTNCGPGGWDSSGSVHPTSSISESYGTIDVYPYGLPVFFNESSSFSAGTYKVTYIDGAMLYTVPELVGYSIHDSGTPPNGYKILYNNGNTESFAPGDRIQYASVENCRIANTGSYVAFIHTGGSIGIYLFDYPYWDNEGGPITYKLDRLS